MSTGAARPSDSQYQNVFDQYTAAMKLFGQQKFERAKPLLEKVCGSPYRELAERAALHLNTCNTRLDHHAAKPQSPEDYYHQAIVRMNAAQYQEAEELLTKAMRGGGKGAHLSYALACLRAQTNDPEAALVHLKEAIRGDAHCRALARQDRDFDPLMDDPRFTEILYPETRGLRGQVLMPSYAVLILAAGRGTRMRSSLPKVLHQAGGRSLLGNVLAAVRAAGVKAEDTAVIAGYGADAIRAVVKPLGHPVHVQEPQLGTGHAVQAAQAWWAGYHHVIVVHGDMPLLSAATVRGLIEARSAATAIVATACPEEPRPYGRILRSPDTPELILAIVEDSLATPEQKRIRELNAGFYCFETEALAAALSQLGTANPHGEYYLTDTISLLAGQGHRVLGLPLADKNECLGVNDRGELAQLDQWMRHHKAHQLLGNGVSVQLPDTVVVDPEVEVGTDTVIETGVQLLGATRIGTNCRIRSYSILTDCVIGDGVLIRPHCVLESARVGAGALLGPFTRLREGADIGAGAHVGNFVEVKKSRIGAGSKANHLAYLGDATIGGGTNIGAGTITCNYDGRHKHATTIGDNAFIGSNATVVAPVEIGAGAYVAAGSVVTEDVPADALALGRARQENKLGWAAKRRNRR